MQSYFCVSSFQTFPFLERNYMMKVSATNCHLILNAKNTKNNCPISSSVAKMCPCQTKIGHVLHVAEFLMTVYKQYSL